MAEIMNTAGDIMCPRCGEYNGNHSNNCLLATFENWRPRHIVVVGKDQEMTITKIGWEGPICHRGLSPDVTICEHSGVSMDSVMEQIANMGIDGDKIVSDDSIKKQMFSGSPINFDSWKDIQWYDDDDED